MKEVSRRNAAQEQGVFPGETQVFASPRYEGREKDRLHRSSGSNDRAHVALVYFMYSWNSQVER